MQVCHPALPQVAAAGTAPNHSPVLLQTWKQQCAYRVLHVCLHTNRAAIKCTSWLVVGGRGGGGVVAPASWGGPRPCTAVSCLCCWGPWHCISCRAVELNLPASAAVLAGWACLQQVSQQAVVHTGTCVWYWAIHHITTSFTAAVAAAHPHCVSLRLAVESAVRADSKEVVKGEWNTGFVGWCDAGVACCCRCCHSQQ